MNISNSAMDRWITGNYGEDAFRDEPVQPRCKHCGAFLSWKADRTEGWEDRVPYDPEYDSPRDNPTPNPETGQPEIIIAAGITETWECQNCGQETRISG